MVSVISILKLTNGQGPLIHKDRQNGGQELDISRRNDLANAVREMNAKCERERGEGGCIA